MNLKEPLVRSRLRAPKAAAIAGIVFSVLLSISLVLILQVIPSSLQAGNQTSLLTSRNIPLALNLVPFSGIAFLWFMGVVRDRLGKAEDQFFSTVFFGSGLLFLALLFGSAAVSGSFIRLYDSQPNIPPTSEVHNFSRILAGEIMHNYAVRMAGVFMISTCTLFNRVRLLPRWMVWLGYGLAAIMLLRIGHLDRLGWVILAFPLWVLLISISILIENYRRKPGALPE